MTNKYDSIYLSFLPGATGVQAGTSTTTPTANLQATLQALQAQSQVVTANQPGAAATITTPAKPAAAAGAAAAGAATVSTITKPPVTQTVVVKAGTALSPPGMAPQVRMHTPGGRRMLQVTKPSPDPNVSKVVLSFFPYLNKLYGGTAPQTKI